MRGMQKIPRGRASLTQSGTVDPGVGASLTHRNSVEPGGAAVDFGGGASQTKGRAVDLDGRTSLKCRIYALNCKRPNFFFPAPLTG